MADPMAGIMKPPSPAWLARFLPFAKAGFGKATAIMGAGQGITQGLSQGVGFAAGQLVARPVKGIFGWVVNFFPENIYGWFLWMAAAIYYIDWRTGFDISATSQIHLWFAVAFFFIIGFTQRFLNVWTMLSASALFFSLYGAMNGVILRDRIIAGVALVISLLLYRKSSAPGFFKLLPLIVFFDVYGMPAFRELILGYAQNVGFISFAVAFILNRILFPIWLWFGILAMYNNTRVAKKLFAVIMVFYLIVSVPTITAEYRARVSSLTSEEKEVAGSVWERFVTNARSILSGEFLRAPVASAYTRAEETFGFGDPKEEPKIGLEPKTDSMTAKEYDLNYGEVPIPSFIMAISNPFPPDVEEPYVKVLEVTCVAKPSDNSEPIEATSVKSDTGEELKGTLGERMAKKDFFEVYYGGSSSSGTGVTCYFKGKDAEWKNGKTYSIEARVRYLVTTNAYLENSFMRLDEVQELRRNQLDPVTVKKLTVAKAEHDNTPVALTWGPPVLANTPATIGEGGIKLYVSKSASWGKGQLYGIESLNLFAPENVELSGTTCAFMPIGSNEYIIKSERVKNNGKYRFFGDSASFSCGMNVDEKILGGADWAPARFEAEGTFIFETKFIGAGFKVIPKASGVGDTPPVTTSGADTPVETKPGSIQKIGEETLSITKTATNSVEYAIFKVQCEKIKGAKFEELAAAGTLAASEMCTCPEGTKWASTDITKGCV